MSINEGSEVVLIRNLKWEDFNDLISNYYSYYDELKDNPQFGIIFRNKIPSMNEEVIWFSNMYNNVCNKNTVAKVAEINGRIVGLCDVCVDRADSEKAHIGVLGITIRNGYRNKGVGYRLISNVIDSCRGIFEVIRLGVFSTNIRAIKLYEKAGFVKYGELPYSVKRGSEYIKEILMYLKL